MISSHERSRITALPRLAIFSVTLFALIGLISCFGANKVTSPTKTTPIAVSTVAVSPASATLSIGGSTGLSALVEDANGNELKGRTVSWSSEQHRRSNGQRQRHGVRRRRRLRHHHRHQRRRERQLVHHGDQRSSRLGGRLAGLRHRQCRRHAAIDRDAQGRQRQRAHRARGHVVERQHRGRHGQFLRPGPRHRRRLGEHHRALRGPERLIGHYRGVRPGRHRHGLTDFGEHRARRHAAADRDHQGRERQHAHGSHHHLVERQHRGRDRQLERIGDRRLGRHGKRHRHVRESERLIGDHGRRHSGRQRRGLTELRRTSRPAPRSS